MRVGVVLFLVGLSGVLGAAYFPHTRGLLLGGYLILLISLFLARERWGFLFRFERGIVLWAALFLFSLVPAVIYSPYPGSSFNAFWFNYLGNFILFLSLGLYGPYLWRKEGFWAWLFFPHLLFLLAFTYFLLETCVPGPKICFFRSPVFLAEKYFVGVAALAEPVLFFTVMALVLWGFYRSRKFSWGWLGIGLASLGSLVFMGRRGALLGLLVGFGSLLFGGFRFRKLGFLVTGLGFLLVIGLLLTPYGRIYLIIRGDTWRNLFSEKRGNTSLGARLEGWPVYLKYIWEHPLKGTGLGRKVQKRVTQDLRKTIPPTMTHAHNTFMNIALQAGWPAAILFLIFYLRLLGRALWGMRNIPPPEGYLWAGLWVFGVAFLIAGMFEGLEKYTKFMPFWLGAGLLLGLSLSRHLAERNNSLQEA